MKTLGRYPIILFVLTALLLMAAFPQLSPNSQTDNSNPPDEVVKLIFIHHSTGENWLTDGYGDLGRTLGENNYFVSDTNYGWGPDSIGDRTDIPNWTEWFASANTPTYMDAIYNESEQNSSYTRTLDNPGIENEIIMFKSCFPNSALEGSPNDPPGTYEELSVSGAKYVYNTILGYFTAHPDKLFIVITAPPLSDSTYAKNARAINQWLVNDWLHENNYTLNNVAVFDFYNILTDSNAHHRVKDGQIEHITGTRNTLYYPSGDDHPSVEGSRKATEEFLPMLNVFYHRWKENAPLQPALEPAPATEAGAQPEPPAAPLPSGTLSLLDDFEGNALAGTSGWESYFQDNTDTQLGCAPESGNAHGGAASLKFEFDVAPNSWATCGFYFDSAQNWSAGQGVSFYLRADRAGLPFDVDLYGGSPGGRSTYILRMETPSGSENDWMLVEIGWADILRAEWEENPGTPFNPAEVTGFSIGLSTPEQERISGRIWVDDLSLLGTAGTGVDTPPETLPMVATSAPEQPGQPEQPRKPLLPCSGAIALPLSLVLGICLWRRKRE